MTIIYEDEVKNKKNVFLIPIEIFKKKLVKNFVLPLTSA